MIEHVWSVLCSRAVVDRYSNNVSMQNVVEQISISEEPRPDAVLGSQMDLITFWTRAGNDEPGRGESRVYVISPSGERRPSIEQKVDLTKHARLRNRLTIQMLKVAESGRYSFVVEYRNHGDEDWTRVASVPLQVIFEPPEPETAETEVTETK
jgi:hypothetical protein